MNTNLAIPVWKKWWFWLIAVVVILMAIFPALAAVIFILSIPGIPVAIWYIWYKSKLSLGNKKVLIGVFSGLFVVLLSLIIYGIATSKTETKIVKNIESISFKTVKKESPDILRGQTKINQKGKRGEKEVTYKNTYLNGELESRKKIKEKIIKKPVDEIILVGTRVIVKKKIATKAESIPFETIHKDSNKLKEGKTVVQQEGKPGKKIITNEVTYENGKLVSSKKIKEEVSEKPIPKIVLNGTDSSPSKSEARKTTDKVKATLDVTTLEEFMSQMPDNVQPNMERDGENRIFTWIFSDGSKLIAIFRPKGGEGSQQGLVLYSVDLQD